MLSARRLRLTGLWLAAFLTLGCAEKHSTGTAAGRDREAERAPLVLTPSPAMELFLASGLNHTCSYAPYDGGGNIQCWGANDRGQLAIRLPESDENSCGQDADSSRLACAKGKINADVEFGRVTSLTAGDGFTCMVSDQAIWCWGDNRLGQLGLGFSGKRAVHPFPVVGLNYDAIAVSANFNQACGLRQSGRVFCWGDGDPQPTEVSGVAGARAIAVGGNFACALLEDTTLRCWGANSAGQLGNPARGRGPRPVLDASGSPLRGVQSVSAGFDHACALAGDAVLCWGNNVFGAVGIDVAPSGGSFVPVPTAVKVVGLEQGAQQVAVGARHACAVLTNGAVRCWGANEAGQLGDGSQNPAYAPVEVAGLHGHVIALATGGAHSCAAVVSGQRPDGLSQEDRGVLCWGANSFGQLGDRQASGRLSLAPVAVSGQR